MTIDVIILSNTANMKYYTMLRDCITSIKNSVGIETNIILIESNEKLKNKKNEYLLPIDVFYVPDDEKFNYNKFQNYGISLSKNDIVCFSNNDVIYSPHTLKSLCDNLSLYDSVSPWEPSVSPLFHSERSNKIGYATRKYITGWCICTTKKTLETIGSKFDESFSFWYADDDYSKLLEKHKLTHALIGDAEAVHLIEQSHNLWNPEDRISQTTGQSEKFELKWKK